MLVIRESDRSPSREPLTNIYNKIKMTFQVSKEQGLQARQQLLSKARRVVVKVGSAVLTTESGLNRPVLKELARDLDYLLNTGHEVILVSSGAVAAGRKGLGLGNRRLCMKEKQAAAAFGQSVLMRAYEEILEPLNHKVAQVLLTHNDLANRDRYLNIRNTLFTMFSWHLLPIINENDTVSVKELRFGYTPEKILFENISFTLAKGETLGIIGKNGKGKSTLLNTIAGELKQNSGEINFNANAKVAHFGQTNIVHLSPDNTIMDEIYNANPKLGEANVRAICGGMMFSGDSASKKISLLSGGEKSRVMLGQIIARNVNVLLLDEPTNHLDIDSIEALTNAIKNFKGSSIIVTHSQELLRRVCDRLIIFAKDGAEYFDGGYDDFLEKIGWDDEDENEEKVKKAPKSSTKENKKIRAELVRERNKLTSPLKKRVEKLEDEIMELENTLSLKHEALIKASNEGDSTSLMELSKSVSQMENEVEALFEVLEEEQTLLDTIVLEYEEKMSVYE